VNREAARIVPWTNSRRRKTNDSGVSGSPRKGRQWPISGCNKVKQYAGERWNLINYLPGASREFTNEDRSLCKRGEAASPPARLKHHEPYTFRSRILESLQFGFTITYHYLFPQLTMGLAWFLVYWKWRALRTGDDKYNKAARFWARIFGLNFAVGVVTGIPMNFSSERTGAGAFPSTPGA